MSRPTLFLLAAVLAVAGYHSDPKPMTPKEGELPPLPPASGTAVGYLVDNATQLKLRDDQLTQLKQIDTSLAARNDSIDTQLRSMVKPDEEQPQKGQPPPRHNNAPGAQVRTTGDAGKLQEAKAANDKDALVKAFALLDADQQAAARRLLDERGIVAPGAAKKEPSRTSDDGVPLEP
jgi:hypothetical protein